MNQYFLKFTDEQSAVDALAPLELKDVYHVGVITKVIDEETTETVEGWHVNILAESLPEELAEFELVGISTPVCVFAGY